MRKGADVKSEIVGGYVTTNGIPKLGMDIRSDSTFIVYTLAGISADMYEGIYGLKQDTLVEFNIQQAQFPYSYSEGAVFITTMPNRDGLLNVFGRSFTKYHPN